MAAARVDGQAVSGDFHLLSMEGSSDAPTDCLDFIHRTSEAPWARAQGLNGWERPFLAGVMAARPFPIASSIWPCDKCGPVLTPFGEQFGLQHAAIAIDPPSSP